MSETREELIKREPCGRPHHGDNYGLTGSSRPDIQFCHPAYDDESCVLFVLHGYDSLDHGLHHETARLICFIFADNRDGWFTTERDGEKIRVSEDGLLKLDRYFFRVSSDYTEKYPIVPTFVHWKFPHNSLPEYWKKCTDSIVTDVFTDTTLRGRDMTCRLSNCANGTEQAHLIPQAQERWFSQNGMQFYSHVPRPDDNAISTVDNMILLRSDIHSLFDQQRITFLPKPSQDPNRYSMVAHVLTSSRSTELIDLYHNVPLQQLKNVPLEYLFARFAWSVLPLLATFLRQGSTRLLSVVGENGRKMEAYNGSACYILAMQNRARTESPKKRKQNQTEEHCMCGDPLSESDSDGEKRGRKRKRSTSFTWRYSFESGVLSQREHGPKAQRRKRIIIDTDMLNFDDDPLAIGLANIFHLHGEAQILGIMSSIRSQFAPPAIDAINTYYGNGNIPVAIRKPVDNSTIDVQYPQYREYLTGLAYNFPEDIKNGLNTTDPVQLYRQLLTQVPEQSVTITLIGFADNLYNLLLSEVDDFSNRTGAELVQRKVAELVVQGNPTGPSFNFLRYNTISAQYVLTHWPGRVTFVPDTIGDTVYIGRRLTTELNVTANPVAYSFATCIGINRTHQAWDASAMYYAVRGLDDVYSVGFDQGGVYFLDNGSAAWNESAPSHLQRSIALKVDNITIANRIETALVDSQF